MLNVGCLSALWTSLQTVREYETDVILFGLAVIYTREVTLMKYFLVVLCIWFKDLIMVLIISIQCLSMNPDY